MTDRPLLNRFNQILIAALALVTIAGFLLVPLGNTLPIHWDINGVPDNFAPAPVALLLPVAMAGFVIGLILVLRRSGLRADIDAGRHLVEVSNSFVLLLAILLSGMTILIGMGHEVSVPRILTFAIGAMLVCLGNYLPKTQANRVAGVRVPWTLRNPANWTITHRWAGWLTMLGGAAAILAATFITTPATLIVVVLAAALLPAIASIAISYALSRP
ncbi:SdpI family protein [Devosia faecipullorum]|uniref:SdpI family protein n=1 Tax=Devosia faecipullorum TaxID=2755039 RepID=UPI00187B745F|nr:SdpI family protein [Devosia faecipullorum]MBE7731492.1 SdpI family protein [Devosia faecipullorum]